MKSLAVAIAFTLSLLPATTSLSRYFTSKHKIANFDECKLLFYWIAYPFVIARLFELLVALKNKWSNEHVCHLEYNNNRWAIHMAIDIALICKAIACFAMKRFDDDAIAVKLILLSHAFTFGCYPIYLLLHNYTCRIIMRGFNTLCIWTATGLLAAQDLALGMLMIFPAILSAIMLSNSYDLWVGDCSSRKRSKSG
ncbi:hypothetical protein GJ496_002864 [Pomphorhynchus laevis]|nr:hypothetical protein GJ496_002864 [Pomphorhynchus laevis]